MALLHLSKILSEPAGSQYITSTHQIQMQLQTSTTILLLDIKEVMEDCVPEFS